MNPRSWLGSSPGPLGHDASTSTLVRSPALPAGSSIDRNRLRRVQPRAFFIRDRPELFNLWHQIRLVPFLPDVEEKIVERGWTWEPVITRQFPPSFPDSSPSLPTHAVRLPVLVAIDVEIAGQKRNSTPKDASSQS